MPADFLVRDVPALKNEIDGIKQNDRKSRLKHAYQLADAKTNLNPEQLRPGQGQLPDGAAARFHRFDVVADAGLGFG